MKGRWMALWLPRWVLGLADALADAASTAAVVVVAAPMCCCCWLSRLTHQPVLPCSHGPTEEHTQEKVQEDCQEKGGPRLDTLLFLFCFFWFIFFFRWKVFLFLTPCSSSSLPFDEVIKSYTGRLFSLLLFETTKFTFLAEKGRCGREENWKEKR